MMKFRSNSETTRYYGDCIREKAEGVQFGRVEAECQDNTNIQGNWKSLLDKSKALVEAYQPTLQEDCQNLIAAGQKFDQLNETLKKKFV